MNLGRRTAAAVMLLVATGTVIRVAHLDRDNQTDPSVTEPAAQVVTMMHNCEIQVTVSKATSGHQGADIHFDVNTAFEGYTTLYVYGDGGYGVKGTWHGKAGGFTWDANLPHSTVKGVKYVSGFIVDMNGAMTKCGVTVK